jgi:hypothetical protein
VNDEMQTHILTRDPRTMSPAELQAAINKPETSYDEELDSPLYHDKKIVADMLEMRRNTIRSSNQNIEEALRQYELSYNHEGTRRQRWAGQKRWMGKENEEMRLVRIMHPYKFLERLRRAGVDARPEEHKHARIWLNPWSKVGRIGVNARIFGEVRTMTTLQYPYGPEYTIMAFNQYDVPTEERYRGWRTALLVLIVAEVITEEEALKAFGPAIGPASEFYHEQLHINRRVKMGLQL